VASSIQSWYYAGSDNRKSTLKKASTNRETARPTTWEIRNIAAMVAWTARSITHAPQSSVWRAARVQPQQVNSTIREPFVRDSILAGSGSTAFSLLVLLCLLVCAVGVYAVAKQTPQNSDSVQGFMEAQSILNGNLLLSGWHLTNDNYVFTDTPFFVAYEWLFGARMDALMVVPTVIYMLILLASLGASVRSLKPTHHNMVALATIVLLIGLPTLRLPSADPLAPSSPLFLADFHAASILFALVALILLSRLARAVSIGSRPFLASILALTCVMAVMSDPYTLFFAFGPAVFVLLCDVALAGDARKDIGLTVIVAVSTAVGMALPRLISRLGGFEIWDIYSLKFVAPENLGTSLEALFFGLFYSADAYVFGKQALETETMMNLARLFGWILGVTTIIWNYRRLLRYWRRSLLDRLLFASIVTLILECVFSDQFSFDLTADIFHGGRGRVYIAPIIILGAILIARAIPVAAPKPPLRRLQIAAQGALMAISTGALVTHVARSLTMLSSPAWVNANPYLDAGRWLEASGLTEGVGGYFDSSIIRALTKGRVGVNAVSAEPGARLEPFVFDTDAHFYLGKETPMFAIWRTGDDPFDWYRVNADTVKATYGSPTRVEHLPGGFVVEILREPPK
jgi:hypothetical protein